MGNVITKNNLFILLSILIIIDIVRENSLLNSTVAVIIFAVTTIYMLTSGLKLLINTSNEFKEGNYPYWEYRKLQIDWITLLQACSILFLQSLYSGPIKYLLLVQGILMAIYFLIKMLIAIKFKIQIIGLRDNKLIAIKRRLITLQLDKSEIISSSSSRLILKDGWLSVTIFPDKMKNGEEIIEKVVDSINHKSNSTTEINSHE